MFKLLRRLLFPTMRTFEGIFDNHIENIAQIIVH